jgi:hypothetical protein
MSSVERERWPEGPLWCETHDKPMEECQPDSVEREREVITACDTSINKVWGPWCSAHNKPAYLSHDGNYYCTRAPDTPQSVPTCTCSKHPLWDGYDGDCPIHGWFEPVAPDTPQSVPATEKRDTDAKTTIRSNRDEHNPDSSSAPAAMVAALAPDAPLSQGEDEGLRVLEYLRVRKLSVIDDDRLASLIAERDKLAKGYQAAIDHAAQLVERVSVLEGALEEYAAMGDDLGDLARAALRTSEER